MVQMQLELLEALVVSLVVGGAYVVWDAHSPVLQEAGNKELIHDTCPR